MRRFCPSLTDLQAFEVAARHSSFTRAAQELCVTQGAVSKQVKHLEEFVGSLLEHMFEKRRTLSALFRVMEEDADLRKAACDSRNHPALEIRQRTGELFRRGVAEGRFRACDPALMDAVLHATLHGVIHEFIAHENRVRDIEEAIPALKDLILHGFCPKENRKP